MTSHEFYRLNAEDCLRKAANDDAGKPLWATLARSATRRVVSAPYPSSMRQWTVASTITARVAARCSARVWRRPDVTSPSLILRAHATVPFADQPIDE